MNTYYFKPNDKSKEDFYLRFDNDNILYFREKDNNIFSALDIYKLIVKGKMNNETIYSSTCSVIDFITNRITNREKAIVIKKDNLEYSDTGSYIYVDLKDNNLIEIDNVIHIDYNTLDSDRHKDKERISFKINVDNGIVVKHDNYFLYLDYNLFSKYQVKKL